MQGLNFISDSFQMVTCAVRELPSLFVFMIGALLSLTLIQRKQIRPWLMLSSMLFLSGSSLLALAHRTWSSFGAIGTQSMDGDTVKVVHDSLYLLMTFLTATGLMLLLLAMFMKSAQPSSTARG